MIVGLAGGIAVGGGYVAFLAVLGVIPRLAQLTRSGHRIQFFEWAVILGSLLGAWCSLRDVTFLASQYWLIILGLFCGTFVGMLAAALTEVLNVLPILAKRVGVDGKIVILLVALVLGKVIGSLFHWIYFCKVGGYNMTQNKLKDDYTNKIKDYHPKPNYVMNCVKAFVVGGLICTVGEVLMKFYMHYFHFSEQEAETLL